MNFDLRTSATDPAEGWKDMSQRMLNVLLADSVIPSHRHTFIAHEDGTTIFEAKDRPYDPVATEEFLEVG